jgi:hypothetical protein
MDNLLKDGEERLRALRDNAERVGMLRIRVKERLDDAAQLSELVIMEHYVNSLYFLYIQFYDGDPK